MSVAAASLQRGPSHDQFQRTHTPVHFGSAMPPPQPPGGGHNPWDQGGGDYNDDAEIDWDPDQEEYGAFLSDLQLEEDSMVPQPRRRGPRPDGTLSMTPRAIKQRAQREAAARAAGQEPGSQKGGNRPDGSRSMTPNAIKRRQKRVEQRALLQENQTEPLE